MNNLAFETAFLPVSTLNGNHEHVTLRDALVRAHELRGIEHPDPRVNAALIRFVTAVMVAAHRPYTDDTITASIARAAFDAHTIDTYLDTWRNAFDLCDPLRPFYQHPDAPNDKATRLVTIDARRSSGSNIMHWNHTNDHDDVRYTPAETAQLLITAQAYSPGGLRSTNINGLGRSSLNALTASATITIARGKNLHYTLLGAAPPAMTGNDDLPTWERPVTEIGTTRQPTGLVDVLTWQARTYRLTPPTNGHFTHTVDGPGDIVAEPELLYLLDPHTLEQISISSPKPGNRAARQALKDELPPGAALTPAAIAAKETELVQAWHATFDLVNATLTSQLDTVLTDNHTVFRQRAVNDHTRGAWRYTNPYAAADTTFRTLPPRHIPHAQKHDLVDKTAVPVTVYQQFLSKAKIDDARSTTTVLITDPDIINTTGRSVMTIIDSVKPPIDNLAPTLNTRLPQLTNPRTAVAAAAEAVGRAISESPFKHHATIALISEVLDDLETNDES